MLLTGLTGVATAQTIKTGAVPAATKSALSKKYPQAGKVGREKEKGNFEANWGGKSGEGLSVQFTPDGRFTEQVAAISPGKLPAHISIYIRQHYSGTKINGAGKITDAKGAIIYEAEVKGKDLIFDEKGNFLKIG